MKSTGFLICVLSLCTCVAMSSDARPVKDALRGGDVRKGGEERGEPLQLDVNIAIAPGWGETITDENGTTYNFFGMSFYEPKIYPPEYWGVFPLFFFGGSVGIEVTVRNECASQAVNLRVTTECYCLNTDGSNGAQLLAPQEAFVELAAGEEETLDATFVGEAVDGADSGLDRFLVKVFHNEDVYYDVVQNSPNSIKFEGALAPLGDDGAKEKDTFCIYVSGSAGPVSVVSKAGNVSAISSLAAEGDSVLDNLGFQVTLEQKVVEVLENPMPPPLPGQPPLPAETTTTTNAMYVLSVASVQNQRALSHVEFIFEEGAEVFVLLSGGTGQYLGDRQVLDGESSSLIMVKEGVFCPPMLDEELTELVESVVGN